MPRASVTEITRWRKKNKHGKKGQNI